MVFVLKHFDEEILKFAANENSSNPDYKILWVTENKFLLPLGFNCTEQGLESWIKHRAVPRNRAYMDNLLAKCNLSTNRPLSVVYFSKGLSLNDVYWVAPEDFNGSFDDVNLYDNRFSRVLSYIAFTGYGSSLKSSLFSSPEFTTNGMLPKCWRRIIGKIGLYKGSTSGFSNAGYESYSEFYAFQIAKEMGFDAVEYNLSRWKCNLCSTCRLFTSKEYSFVPVGNLVKKGGFEAVLSFYKSLGKEFEKSLNDMLVFDAIIKNTDRHYGNFGFLVNNRTNKIEKPAPLFDHGNSLYNLASLECFEKGDTLLRKYDKTLQPCVYDDFIGTAKKVLTAEHKERLRSLLNFKFKKHPRYNVSEARLERVNEQVLENVRELLG
ncbi:MAG: hypothetical protein UIB61_05320 [Treponema sp.]|jgi:hypothetical protein|nr:hypothetical protein [Treponema sp.]